MARLVISAAIDPTDISGLCESARDQLEADAAGVVVCDVGAIVDPDGTTVDALARLQLAARRLGFEIRLLDASCRLRELLALCGVSDVVPVVGGSGWPRGQAEEREQACGVEEGIDPDDPTR